MEQLALGGARRHGLRVVSHGAPIRARSPGSSLRVERADRSSSETKLLDRVVKRVRAWKDVAPYYPDQTRGLPKTAESRGTEAILNASILARRDATDGALTDDTRLAFSNLWALQMRTGELTGAWAWL